MPTQSRVTCTELPPSEPAGVRVEIVLLRRDLEHLEMNNFDQHLLNECGRSNQAADVLLGLELIFRRAAQQNIRIGEIHDNADRAL